MITTANTSISTCNIGLGWLIVFRIDGYVRRQPEERDIAIEIYGCWFHACPRCYPDDNQIVAYGETAGAIRRRDAKINAEMERDMEVKIKWECRINERLLKKEEMKAFFDTCIDTGPIEIHDV
jgi:G:T-mismatch repair DNA endonuclease (very short patch repair protein)